MKASCKALQDLERIPRISGAKEITAEHGVIIKVAQLAVCCQALGGEIRKGIALES